MGLVQSVASRASSAMQSIGVLTSAEFSLDELFDAVLSGDTSTVSYMLDGSHVDLTRIDEASGDTVLHLAALLDHGAMAQLLLEKAGDDPSVLNVLNRQGCTPLMLAAQARNVALMKALVDAGSGVGGQMSLAALKGEVNYRGSLKGVELLALTALLLMEARGDISKAFELAVEYEVSYAEKLYLDAGADVVSAVQRVPCPRGVARMFNFGYVSAGDKFAILEQATLTGYAGLKCLLARYDELSSVLDHMKDRSDAEKIAAIKCFVNADQSRVGLWAEWAVDRCLQRGKWDEQAFRSKHFDYLKLMVSAGAPMGKMLLRMARHHERVALQRLVEVGADVNAAMSMLREKEGHERHTDVRCIDILKDAVTLRNLLQKDCDLLEEEKIAALKVLMHNGMREVADEVVRDKVKAEHSLETVRVLILAGASTTKALMDLGRRTSDIAAARATVRQLMHFGVDAFPAINRLLEESRQYERNDEHDAAKAALDAANFIAAATLEHVLQTDTMSEAEKVSALKALLDAGGQSAAGELIRDAVKAGQSLDGVRLLILAGAWTTSVLMDLSRTLTRVEAVRQLIHLGANFFPAMTMLLEHGEQQAANVLALAVAAEHAPALRELSIKA